MERTAAADRYVRKGVSASGRHPTAKKVPHPRESSLLRVSHQATFREKRELPGLEWAQRPAHILSDDSPFPEMKAFAPQSPLVRNVYSAQTSLYQGPAHI